VHHKRGKQATDEIGILPEFHGISEHDAYSLYHQYTLCSHGLCNAHNLRDLRFLHEHEKQKWAGQLKDHLLVCHTTVEEARAKGATSLPKEVIEQLTATYHHIIEAGLAAQPPPPPAHPDIVEESNKARPRISWIGCNVMHRPSYSS